MKSATEVSYRSILEGNPPGMLYYQLGHLTPFRRPCADDFSDAGAGRVFGAGDTRNVANKPFASRGEPWLLIGHDGVRFTHAREGAADVFRWETPLGPLSARRASNHMMEYPVKTPEDIPRWRHVQESLRYSPNPAFEAEARDALWKMGYKWSPVQELLQFETGIENFYYFLADARDEMESLMEAMHRKNLEALEIGFQTCTGSTVFQLGENTSASLISPDIYRRHTLPHVRAYADMAHRHGMKCIVHMCGHLTSLFGCFAETGMDGIHAVTPPPVGDTHYMAVRERFGEGFVIVGRLSAQVWIGKGKGEILETLRAMIPDRLIRTPFSLWVSTDEMQPTEEDVYALTEAMEAYNAG